MLVRCRKLWDPCLGARSSPSSRFVACGETIATDPGSASGKDAGAGEAGDEHGRDAGEPISTDRGTFAIENEPGPAHLITDGVSLVWSTSEGAVRRCVIADCKPFDVAREQAPIAALAWDGAEPLWAVGADIRRVGTAGPETLAHDDASEIVAFVHAGATSTWTTRSGIAYRLDDGSGWGSRDVPGARGIVGASASQVLFAASGGIYRAGRTLPSDPFVWAAREDVAALATDGAAVFFATGGASGELFSAEAASGTPSPDVKMAGGLHGVVALAVDATSVWAITTSDGAVIRIPRDGGAPAPIASGLLGPRDIAVADGWVFVAETGASRIAWFAKE